MSDASLLLFLYTETPLHVGCGEGLGAVDLPIMREKLSALPVVPGSGIKGALREVFEDGGDDDPKHLTNALFGPPPPDRDGVADDAETHAGAMMLLDARLLLLPVRSVFGGFAWVTSPLVLGRLARDIERMTGPGAAGGARPKLPIWHDIAVEPATDEALETALVGRRTNLSKGNELLIEDLPFRPVAHEKVDALADTLARALPPGEAYDPFRERLGRHLMVVSDAELAELSKRYVEIVTRTRIDPETGTVHKGGLWTEENLPSETLLWSVAAFERSRHPNFGLTESGKSGRHRPTAEAMRAYFANSAAMQDRRRLRIGGNRTVGRGLVGLSTVNASALVGEEG